jgi:1,4-alpha-glucan branching enzyme
MEPEGDAVWRGISMSRHMQFKFYAPEAHRVSIAGDLNGWDTSAHQLSPKEKGLWLITVELPPGRCAYKFFVDGIWRIDPDAASYIVNAHGTMNCVITVE